MTGEVSSNSRVIFETNSPPSLAPVSDHLVFEGHLLQVTNLATDPDFPANDLTFALVGNVPTGMTIDYTNGIVQWLPGEADGSTSNLITVTVQDNGAPPLTAMQSFSVTVLKTNSPPNLSPLPEFTVIEGQWLFITNSGFDLDLPAQTLSFALGTNAPVGMSIDPTNGIIAWLPGEIEGPGTNMVTVEISDDEEPSLSATQAFTIIVLETNSPPALAAFDGRVVHAGSIVSFQATASDPDLPANALSFSLGSGAPPGATINETNGVFTWQTSDFDAATTNQVLIAAADNGVPALMDSGSVAIVVLPRPSFEHITVSNGVTVLTWRSIPGKTYRVQFEEVLGPTNWMDLSAYIQASDSVLTFSAEAAAASQGFYRLIVAP